MGEREDKVKKQIEALVKEYFSLKSPEKFKPGVTTIPLITPSYGWEEVTEAIDSLLSTRVTMGAKVKQFESMFASYIGVKHAVMVNSGSSANLMALSALTNPVTKNHIKLGDEIITPAVTWATTVWPIIDCGAVPVLVDVELDTFNIDPREIRKAITPATRAIMPVHLLGNPCDMDEINKIAREHDLYVIEDACESHGAEFRGKKTGSFSDMSTFSFFFSHHMTTIEGGMVLTDNEELAELLRSLRVFGWIRDLKDKDKIARKHEAIDPRFLFANTGYNFRPMEIQGAFGIHQLKKLDDFVEVRRKNADYWSNGLSRYEKYFLLHREREGTKHAWFGYPVTIKPSARFSRKELTDFLEAKKVETRPVMAGNIAEQPAMRRLNHRIVGKLPNSRLVMRNSFFFGNHQGIGTEEREAIVNYVSEFVDKVMH